jgi:hypothetical protein
MVTTTIQPHSKVKAIQAAGVLMMLAGLYLLFTGNPPGPVSGQLVAGGLPVWIVGRVGEWWSRD